VLGTPVVMSRTPADHHPRAAPALGEHTDEVLAEAGLDPPRIEALHDAAAIGGPDGVVEGSFLS